MIPSCWLAAPAVAPRDVVPFCRVWYLTSQCPRASNARFLQFSTASGSTCCRQSLYRDYHFRRNVARTFLWRCPLSGFTGLSNAGLSRVCCPVLDAELPPSPGLRGLPTPQLPTLRLSCLSATGLPGSPPVVVDRDWARCSTATGRVVSHSKAPTSRGLQLVHVLDPERRLSVDTSTSSSQDASTRKVSAPFGKFTGGS